jgi:hypothetical protein
MEYPAAPLTIFPQTATSLKERIRKACREITFCVALGILIVTLAHFREWHITGDWFADNAPGHLTLSQALTHALVPGFIAAPLLWLVYRFTRFVIGK